MAKVDALVALLMALGSFLGGAGGAEFFKAIFRRRRPKRIEQAEYDLSLAGQAQDYARQAWESARQAWEASDQANARVQELSAKLDSVQYNLAIVSRYVTWLLGLIRQPGMTIEHLREQVEKSSPPPGVNGERR